MPGSPWRSSTGRRSTAGGAGSDDDWDARVYAISPGSASFLRALGVWQDLPAERIAAVETMRVEGDDGGVLRFSAHDLGERALAWIVEERSLRDALTRKLRTTRVAVHAPRTLSAIGFAADQRASFASTTARTLTTRLVVGADGCARGCARAAGIVAAPRPYGQTAVVANFACERAHHGRAHQWFRDDGGILAWLPLPGRRVSIVWSAPDALAAELRALAPDALAARVALAGENALGAFEMHHAGRRLSAVSSCAARGRRAPAGPLSATPRMACIRWRARA